MAGINRARFMVIDGNSLAHRAFYALPTLSNSQGIPTNAVYGFTTMLMKALLDTKPDYIAVAFDKGRVTFRHKYLETYKGQRKATPEELRPQFPLIRRVLDAMNITAFEKEAFEADDLIGTLTCLAEQRGMESIVVTADRDALQLISPLTEVWLTKKGLSTLEVLNPESLARVTGLKPEQVADVKGLMGDASDNIPGVPGIGEKTAVKLIIQYGSLEGVLERLEELPARQRNLLVQYREQAILSKSIATIHRRVPLEVDWESCRRQPPDYLKQMQIFKEMEFQSLLKTVREELEREGLGSPASGPKSTFRPLQSSADVAACCEQAGQAEKAALFLTLDRPDYLKAELRAIGLACPGGVNWAWAAGEGETTAGEIFSALMKALAGGTCLLFHDAKAALTPLERSGLQLKRPAGDTMLASYLLNPTGGGKNLPDLVLEHLNRTFFEHADPLSLAAERAQAILELSGLLEDKLKLAGMEELYRQVEVPLSAVLARMERAGVTLDQVYLEEMGQELETGLVRLTDEIYDLAGLVFNINSSRQLAEVLFNKLGLPSGKKTKTGFSTNAEVLEELSGQHPIISKILEYRLMMKLASTYVEGLKNLVNKDTGRVHTTFNQAVTATGRLSSAEPNLQNIPIRLEYGRKLRKAFLPNVTGWLMLAADYSQIELRVLAHISGDEGLKRAFREGRDIHTSTAAEVFGIPLAEVTTDLRRRAKAVNFGLVYGISDYGLARDLSISRQDARRYIDLYFSRFPGVRRYMEETVIKAREFGYVTTILGRRRYLPDIFSANHTVRSFGERTALNTPIQGSAADLIKLAMLKVQETLEQVGLRAEMLLQVHDELILELPQEELVYVAPLVRNCMEEAFPLEVPLKVDVSYGPNWYDLKEWTEV